MVRRLRSLSVRDSERRVRRRRINCSRSDRERERYISECVVGYTGILTN